MSNFWTPQSIKKLRSREEGRKATMANSPHWESDLHERALGGPHDKDHGKHVQPASGRFSPIWPKGVERTPIWVKCTWATADHWEICWLRDSYFPEGNPHRIHAQNAQTHRHTRTQKEGNMQEADQGLQLHETLLREIQEELFLVSY